MKRFGIPSMRRFLKSQRGQSAVVVMITASTMMALSAASVETGHVYYAYQQLVASTNSAVLAGAQAMPNTTLASQSVTTYSSQSNGLNASPWLRNAVATPTFLCLGTVSTSLNVPCQTSTGGTGGYNAMSVTQTATIPLWFGGLVGMKQMNVSYTAKAAVAGGQNGVVEHCRDCGHDFVDEHVRWRRPMQWNANHLRTAWRSSAAERFISLRAGSNLHQRRSHAGR